jgi:AraC-like DNA-binding protein
MAPTTVRRHESPDGSWELASRPAHPALAGGVRRYVGFVERSPTPLRRREVPQQQVTVILNLGEPLTVGGPGTPPAAHGSFVAPLNESPAVTEFSGVSRGIQVDLAPFAARALVGRPLDHLDALVVDLDDVLGPGADLLVERLHDAPDWDARFDLLDALIARRVEAAGPPPPDAAWAWSRLGQTGGRLPIGALTRELGCSRRHLSARFRDQVGLPPKAVARIMRFRRVLDLLARDDGSCLAEIAQDCGYYDQAHLNRDFRDLAGTTPSAYVGSRLPHGLGVGA